MVIDVIVGTLLGFLSGLGIGGGSLLILWLTLILNMSPGAARSLNLLFFLPSALTAGYFRWRQGAIPFRKILPAITAGCIFAFIFSLLSQQLDTSLLKKLFGVLLILTGLRELSYKTKRTGEGS